MGVFRRHTFGWGIAFSLVGFALLYLMPSFSQLSEVVDEGLQRVVLSVVAFAMIGLLGGGEVLVPRACGVRSALRAGAWPMGISLAVCALDLGVYASGAEGVAVLSSNWLGNLLGCAFLCLFVGFYEEAIMRVLLFNGILSRTGGDRNGVLVAALASSVVFGAIHVLPIGISVDALMLVQMLLKTLQAGCMGMLLASVFVRTRNFYGTALVHTVSDFLLFVPDAIFGDASVMQTDYVGTTASDAVVYIVTYLVMLVFYVPMVVTAVRLLDGVTVPECGCFAGEWHPCEIDVTKEAAGDVGVTPPRPDGIRGSDEACDRVGGLAHGPAIPHYPGE